MADPNDYSTWDLDSLSSEEQELFRSGITKNRDGQSTPEQAAMAKAQEANFGSPGMGKAGISDVRSRQAERLMYSTGELDVDWSKCTVYDTGFYDPENNWVPGVFEGGLFYPDDPEAAALNGPPS
jgi:hypothetical protein